MTPEMQAVMNQTTLRGGHCNYVNRCYYYGVQTTPQSYTNAAGQMSLQHLMDTDPTWARCVEEGTMTLILKWQIREDDEAMFHIISSGNIKHGANMIEHSLQLIRRMTILCRAEIALGVTNANEMRSSVDRRFMKTVSKEVFEDCTYIT